MKVIATSVTMGFIFMVSALPAFAEQNAVGYLFSSNDPGDIGPAISGLVYGNTSSPSGNGEGVLPSLAPGPWICGSPTNCYEPTEPGGSMGDFLGPLGSDGVASPDFANGNDLNIDFSLH